MDPSSARRGYEKVLREGTQGVRTLEALASRLEEARLWDEAVDIHERLVAIQPDIAQRHVGLALALEKATVVELHSQSWLGLVVGPSGRSEDAIEHFEKALALDPGVPAVKHALARVLFAVGDYERGVEQMLDVIEHDPRADWVADLGKVYGRAEVADFVEAEKYLEQALSLDPKHRGARAALLSLTLRMQKWERAWQLLRELQGNRRSANSPSQAFLASIEPLFVGSFPDDPHSALEALKQADEEGSFIAPQLWRHVVARLQFAGHIALGFEVKTWAAAATVRSNMSRTGRPKNPRAVGQAMIYQDLAQDLISALGPLQKPNLPRIEALKIEKLIADAHLWDGDPAPLVEFSRRLRAEHPTPGDQKMQDLVQGKRIALVGPAVVTEEFGDEIDSYDTIIRTRFSKDFVEKNRATGGTRSHIAYYSRRDVGPLYAETAKAVEAGDLELAVARPMAYSSFKRQAVNDTWLRFYRYEYSLYFMSTALGIQRIIYDLLQFEPAEISLYNIDFYAGTEAFAAGYRDPKDTAMAQNSLLNDVFASHDLKKDFEFTQRLTRNGIVKASGVTAKLLGLTPDAYVERLEKSSSLTP
jgi:tetratricopeptide (TPR) repeat protein